ncbi:MAG: hypothetical protein IPJ71_03430 [Bdellovibrionales bacterium]|nr:hypothetical protein [Bdellovibrionales bacterium]
MMFSKVCPLRTAFLGELYYIGQWMSPQTGVVYDKAFKLDLIGSNGKIGNGIYNLFFIFVPGYGNVYTRMEGLDTNKFVTIHSSENISLD